MSEYASKFAEFLESSAAKVRALTVDRANRALTIVSLAIPILVLVLIGTVFLFMTIHGAIAAPLGSAAAFGIMSGLFLIAGLFAWKNRTKDNS